MRLALGFILFVLTGVCNFDTLAQATFSIRNFNNLGKVCSNVFELRNGYLIAGFTSDSTSGYQHTKLCFERYSDAGTLEVHSEFGNLANSYLVSADASIQLTDSTFLLAFNAWPNNVMSCGLVWFDWNCDTLKTKFIPSPNYEDGGDFINWMAPRYLSQDAHSNIYLSSGITNYETKNDIGIFKLDAEGNVIWNYQYLKMTEFDICLSIAATFDGVIAMGGSYNGSEPGNHFTEYFFKLDQTGELLWEFTDRSEFDAQTIEELLLHADGIVSVSAYLDGYQGADAFIYAIDTLDNLLWTGVTVNVGYSSIFSNLVSSCDNSYVCSGNYREVLPVFDSINGIANESILLVKFDSIGNLLWQRKYHYLEAPSDYHRIYDMKATSDGGYIMVGEATDQTGASANWQPILPRQDNAG